MQSPIRDMRHLGLAALFAVTPLHAVIAQTLTLDECVTRALATYPGITGAAEAVRAAQGGRTTARTWMNPTFTYELDQAASPGQLGPGMEREVSAFVGVPLSPLYQLRPRAARADANVRRATSELADTKRTTLAAVTGAFYRVALAQVSVGANDDIRRWLDSLTRYTQARVEQGVAAEADLIRLEVERSREETEVTMDRVELIRARADLGVLVGIDTPSVIVPGTVADDALPPVADLLARARVARPDLQAASARIDAARVSVGVERSMFLHDVDAMVGTKSVGGSRMLMGGFSLPIPLFDQNRGEVQRADAEQKMAVADRALTDRRVGAEVTTLYEAVRSLAAQVTRIETLVARAEEGRRIAEGAYREGAIPLVQVLDAARALADARMTHGRAAFMLAQNRVELRAAVGVTDLGSPLSGAGR